MKSTSCWGALGLLVAVGACAPASAVRPPSTPPLRAAVTSPVPSRLLVGDGDVVELDAQPAPATKRATSPDPVAAVRRALESRANGDLHAAKAALDDADLEVDARGLPAEQRIVRARGGLAAIALDGLAGGRRATVFFDASTGEPTSITAESVFIADPSEQPNAGSPGIFVGSVRAPDLQRSIYDARTGTVLAEGPSILVSRDGTRAYVSAVDGCAWQAWDLIHGKLVGDLERSGETCPRWPSPRLTSDGKALVGSSWWDLETRKIHRVGDQVMSFRSCAPALSDDERYVAYIEHAPMRTDTTPGPMQHQLVVVDRVAGTRTVASEPLGLLSNGSPLSIATDPPRIIVTDYSHWAFSLPALKLLAKDGARASGVSDPLVVVPQATRPDPVPAAAEESAETAPLRTSLERATCTRGGIPVPRDLCDPS